MPPHAPKTEFRTGSLIAGKFKLLRQLGRGASGVVWSAINVTTSRQVALKLLLRPEPKARERLLREARAAGALKHPNVLDVYDVILTEDGSPALVLELLEGQTLQALLNDRAPLAQSEAAAIGRDIARALAIAHASGIIHRDLKPANIFLHRPGDEPPVVKVVDFGISKNLLAGDGTLTETGMAVGSPSFMSPEQVRGEKSLDGRADLWALGTILHEMLCGRRLFDGRPHEVLTRVLVQPIRPFDQVVPNLDPALCRVIDGLLQREVEKRLASADEVAGWLTTIAASSTTKVHEQLTDRPAESAAHDTAVLASVRTPVPKIHEDDDEDEATQVAPSVLRRALAQQSVPSVYTDDDEDEPQDRTRVAGDAELTAAIRASREPASVAAESDQNDIPTVRPPAALAAPASSPPPSRAPSSRGPVSSGPSSRRPVSGAPSSRGPVSSGPVSGGPSSRGPASIRRPSMAPEPTSDRAAPTSRPPASTRAPAEYLVLDRAGKPSSRPPASTRAPAEYLVLDKATPRSTPPDHPGEKAALEKAPAPAALEARPDSRGMRLLALFVLILVVIAIVLVVRRAVF